MRQILGVLVVVCLVTLVTAQREALPEPQHAQTHIIKGQVLSEGGKTEAGVWVIAETNDLPTEYRKIVVTNDEGRFVIPDLPDANYQVWVRG